LEEVIPTCWIRSGIASHRIPSWASHQNPHETPCTWKNQNPYETPLKFTWDISAYQNSQETPWP